MRLESSHPGRRRYLVVINAPAPHDGLHGLASVADQVDAKDVVVSNARDMEYCLLGIDRGPDNDDPNQPQPKLTLGFVVKMMMINIPVMVMFSLCDVTTLLRHSKLHVRTGGG